jgi:hypothetical protein
VCKTRQNVRESLLKLDARVLEIDLAHSNLVDSLLEALTIAKEIDARVSKKWFLVVQSHRKLGKAIRQLLVDLHEIRHQVNENTQDESCP